MAADTLATGKPPERTGNDHPLVAPYGLFRTSDKPIAIAPSNDIIYARLLKALGREDLSTDPRFDSSDKRIADREAIRAEIEPIFLKAGANEWIRRLNEAGVPAGPVLEVAEMFDDPQVRHREMVINVPHEGRGDVRMLGFPIKIEPEGCTLRLPAPELGAHSAEVMGELGYDAERIEKLMAVGVLSKFVGP